MAQFEQSEFKDGNRPKMTDIVIADDGEVPLRKGESARKEKHERYSDAS